MAKDRSDCAKYKYEFGNAMKKLEEGFKRIERGDK
jgi:hypothetical protein